MNRATCAVVLAAGEGTRMKSERPKPLHLVCGRPMVSYVLDAASVDGVVATVVVVGHGATWVEKELAERDDHRARLRFVEQREQLGTGHAVSVALGAIDEAVEREDGDVLILPGDTPLLRPGTISALLDAHVTSGAALTVLSAEVDDPTGYGRLLYDKHHNLARIVEEKDATSDERRIREINTSIMVVRQHLLGPALRRVDRQNAQHEYYLTDLVAVLHDMGHQTQSFLLADASEASGVNDRHQLAQAEAEMRRRINERWLRRGVTMWDPTTTYVDADVTLAADVSLLPGTILKGRCDVGAGAQIGPGALLEDVSVGAGARVGCVVARNATIGEHATVDSFCQLNPGTVLAAGEHYGPGSH